MSNIQLTLSAKRKIPGLEAVFPSDYFEIPELQNFEDLQAVSNYAILKLKQFRGQAIDVFVNAGLMMESFAILKAASVHHIQLRMFHYDSAHDCYVPQEVKWKDFSVEGKLTKKSFALCGNRHLGLPEQSVFETISNDRLFDYSWQEEHAKQILEKYAPCCVDIYLTGLTSLGISALNAAYSLGIPVTVYHYNYDTEAYFPQTMNERKTIGGTEL